MFQNFTISISDDRCLYCISKTVLILELVMFANIVCSKKVDNKVIQILKYRKIMMITDNAKLAESIRITSHYPWNKE